MVIQRTTTALFVKYFHLIEHHVSPVGLGSFWILHCCQLQLIRFTCRLKLIAATIRAHSFQDAWFIGNTIKDMQKMIFTLTLAQRFSVQEEFHLISCTHYIDRLYYWTFIINHLSMIIQRSAIVPMPDNIGLLSLIFHPTVPHHLMSKESILGNTHGIRDTTHTII